MLTLQPFPDEKLKIDSSASEAENEFSVQAELYAMLRASGFRVRGEVRWFDPRTREHCRFDLVLFDAFGEPMEIVEVKARSVVHKDGAENTRQGRRYRRFGVPVTFVYGLDDAKRFISERMGG